MKGELDLCVRASKEPAMDWDALYAEHLPRVYNYMRYRVGDGAVAEDLTGTTMEKAWRARRRFRRDRAAFSTWLYTIARNVANDHFRRRRVTVSLDRVELRAGAPLPEEEAVRADDVACLGALLAGLAARERDLVALKYGAGLSHRSIAALTGLSESNVGTILHRVVQRLRTEWERDDER